MTRLREYAREADELVKKLDDPQRQGWVSSMNCHACVMLAKLTESDHYGHRALAIATELGDVKLRAATTYYLGIAHMLRGSHREATEFLLRNSEAPTASIRDFQSVNASGPMFAFRLAGAAGYTWSRAYAAYSFAELGAFEDSIACGEESQRAAAVLDLTLSRGGADWSLGFAHLRMGSLERARPLLGALSANCSYGGPAGVVRDGCFTSRWCLQPPGSLPGVHRAARRGPRNDRFNEQHGIRAAHSRSPGRGIWLVRADRGGCGGSAACPRARSPARRARVRGVDALSHGQGPCAAGASRFQACLRRIWPGARACRGARNASTQGPVPSRGRGNSPAARERAGTRSSTAGLQSRCSATCECSPGWKRQNQRSSRRAHCSRPTCRNVRLPW